MSLTDRQIKNAKPTDKPYKLSDGAGMFLLVKPNGKKYWQMKYRYLGKEKLLSFGAYPIISLMDARVKRDEAKKLLATDQDPSRVKKEAKLLKQISTTNSFECLAHEWHKNNLPRWTPTHAARILNSLEVDVFPKIGSCPITEIKAPILLDTIRTIEQRGVAETAVRILQRIKSIFNYAIQTGRAEENPAFALDNVVTR